MVKTDKKPNWKKRIVVIAFIIFNAIVILWTALSELSKKEDAAKLSSIEINGWLLIPALLLFVIGISAEISKYFLMMKKCCDISDWKTARRAVLLGRYYDNLTPGAIGGQPFQIMYMNKQGIKKGYNTIIPIVSLITTQLGFLIVAIFSFLFFSGRLEPTILGLGILGLIFYAIFPAIVFLATFFPNILSNIINFFITILYKLRIVKNKKETLEKALKTVESYANCVKDILKRPKLALSVLALSVLFQVCITILPFFIITAFGGSIDFFTCFATILAVTSAVYIFPTPGNTGAAEISFASVFSSLTAGYIFWAMLFWRFFTFYVYILLGIIIYAIIAYEKKTGRHPFTVFINWSKSKFSQLKKSRKTT